MADVRNDIHYPLTERDVLELNNTLTNLWYKLHGDVNLSDVATDVKTQLYTNWLPVMKDGNIDAAHPLYARFFVPPNTKKIKSATLNAITSRYRVDSDVTSSAPSSSSTSSVTSGASSKASAAVDYWGLGNKNMGSPIAPITGAENIIALDSVNDGYEADGYRQQIGYTGGTYNIVSAVAKGMVTMEGTDLWYCWTDLSRINHRHNIDHTHNISVSLSVDGHYHDLNFGIKEASVDPSNVRIYLNDVQVGTAMNGTGTVQNSINMLPAIQIGAWNILKVTSDNIANITLYGILELTQTY